MTTQGYGRLPKIAARKLGIGAVATVATMALTAATLTSYADTTTSASTTSKFQATFLSHYNQNQQQESQLLQKAQAEGGSSATITALSQAVQSINTQVSALYAAELSLSSQAANTRALSSANTSEVQTLKADKQKLAKNIDEAREKIKADLKSRHLTAARRLQLQIKTWQAEINQLNFQLSHQSTGNARWNQAPYDSALPELQQSIFDLQKSAIHYTQAWMNAAKPGAATDNPVSITGLSYALGSVTAPAAGSSDVVDGVAVLPVVKDGAGNVLVDMGTFGLRGPSGAHGVSIDNLTGALSVTAGATAGTYVATYTQGTVSDSVSIVVSE